jgi:hypothetical protein
MGAMRSSIAKDFKLRLLDLSIQENSFFMIDYYHIDGALLYQCNQLYILGRGDCHKARQCQ